MSPFCDLHDQRKVPAELFTASGDLEVTEWAHSPLLFNPTNIDIDRHNRIWVAEGRRYRRAKWSPPADRIMVLEDTDLDGKADKSWVFVEDKELVAPLGIGVIGNKVVVSSPPHLIVYTDVDNNAVFDPKIDKRENILTGFNPKSKDNDHGLHSTTVGPNGQWYFNTGNAGHPNITGKDGVNIIAGSFYENGIHNVGKPSSDGFIYYGGLALRMNPDGTGLRVISHNFRNTYEQSVTSMGDVFHADNDDPPVCRTTYVMEYGNMGYAKNEGRTNWKGTTRFAFNMKGNQSKAHAQWGQDNPGVLPFGDIYGRGSPTGTAFYENGILEADWKGTLLIGEAAKNVIFGYKPTPDKATFALKRFDFLSTTPKEFKGYGWGKPLPSDIRNMFRPSDVCIGADGAIYVSDWFDGRVGGHQTYDKAGHGTIYRVAPKGFKPQKLNHDLDSIDGLIELLKSPAVNVRAIGFYGLKEKGKDAIPAVTRLLKESNPYVRARAIWLLPQLGTEGADTVEKLLAAKDASIRITAFRALRFINHKLLEISKPLATDPDPGVRREVALAMRYIPAQQSTPILLDVIKLWDGADRTMLEAIGAGADNKATEIYAATKSALKDDPRVIRIGWRLHPTSAVNDLQAIAMDSTADQMDRFYAVDGLAFNKSPLAYQAMRSINTDSDGKLKQRSGYWLKYNKTFRWKPYGEAATFTYANHLIPTFPKKQMAVSDVTALKGNAKTGKTKISACFMCHQVGDAGIEFGPTLTGFGTGQTVEMVAKAIVTPDDDIAHGYKATEIKTKDGKTIQGFLISDGDIITIRVMGGSAVDIRKEDVDSRKEMTASAMVAGQDLNLSAQDIRDIIAFLRGA